MKAENVVRKHLVVTFFIILMYYIIISDILIQFSSEWVLIIPVKSYFNGRMAKNKPKKKLHLMQPKMTPPPP
ncbi:hypothetical protein YC2023_101294 [Brassica napus]